MVCHPEKGTGIHQFFHTNGLLKLPLDLTRYLKQVTAAFEKLFKNVSRM